MLRPTRILLLEDCEDDARLILYELRRAGFEPIGQRVETERDFRAHLDPNLDVILADYHQPQFDALRAVRLAQEHVPDVPVIVITGALGDERAVECLKCGAADYLLKDRLARLGQAVTQALDRKQACDDRRRAQETLSRQAAELRESEAALRNQTRVLKSILDSMGDGVIVVDESGAFLHFNPAAERIIGIGRTETKLEQWSERYGLYLTDQVTLAPPEDLPLARAIRGEHVDSAELFVRHAAAPAGLWIQVSGRPLRDEEGQLRGGLVVFQDITARKRTELEIQGLNALLGRRLERLGALRQIDLAITASLDMQLTLNVCLDQVLIQLRVDAADILLYDAQTHCLEYAAGRGFRSTAMRQARIGQDAGGVGQVARERRSLHIADLRRCSESFDRAPVFAEEGFIAYHAVPLVAKGLVKGVLEVFVRTPHEPDTEWRDFLETLAGQAAIAVDSSSMLQGLQRASNELVLAYDATIEGWSRALDLRDRETEGHSWRVTEMSLRLARKMGFNDAELVHVRRGALLHDIGKMGIPDAILLKPGPLTDEERKVMQNHTTYAHEWLSPIAFLRPAVEIPYCHHEKWDGTGYPRGLKGQQIPLPARIFAAVDIWDALRSDRPYRKAWTEERALGYIASLAGTHLDSDVVKAFLRLVTPSDPTSVSVARDSLRAGCPC